jgi:hypothetical protein
MIKSTITNYSIIFVDVLDVFPAKCSCISEVDVPSFSFLGAIHDISVEQMRSEWISAAWVDVAVALVAECAGCG